MPKCGQAKKVGERVVANPEWFGLKLTYWFSRCCGRPMGRFKSVEIWKCDHCGTVEERPDSYLAICSICGARYSKKDASGAYYD